ncbi:ABC transporter substrate-binding protein [Ilumatobacter coccineus]|uniref:Putative ABC transporter substrate-binding protein n=1 Tax=Ilumatobacter coccineus (strain NBRC 103263 / KCTC 29153 / YM16-304) TaxID=1313172 RepID=A0A6C7EAR9_ILUCY|nr:sugar ABC transporter substrate-binding protein [Ilumatobacter coccineus]BAN03480.1 putative ABC transporter substrate-binding protein [Ilumatobacter coccineus YM16-304]
MTLSTSRRRARTAVALTAGLGLLASACGSDSASDAENTDSEPATSEASEPAEETSDEAVTIDYFTFSAAPDHVEDLDAIIAAFEAENPSIDINVSTAAYGDYFTSLQTQLAGGTAPDTFELNYENFVTYARSGALLDLGSSGISTDRYYPLALEGFQDDGTQYGLPATFSDVVLIYNKTLFDEAGLDYPTAEWTWEDEQAAAEALTDADAGVYGSFQPVSFFEFYKALAQAGGQFFDADGNATFNSEAGVAAAEWLTSKPGTIMPTLADIGGTPDFDTNLFQSGKLAMWHNGIWQFNGLNESGVDYDVVVEPGMAQKANAVFMNGVVASSGTDHPEAAAKWIEFLTSSQTTVDTRLASSWELPAVNDEAAFASYLEVTPPANRQAVLDALDDIALPPVIERQAEMQDVVGQALEKIVLDGADIQETLDAAVAEVDDLS